MTSPVPFAVRGVSYATTGNHDPDEVRRITQAIKGELRCTTVMLIDSDLDALSRLGTDHGGYEARVRSRSPRRTSRWW